MATLAQLIDRILINVGKADVGEDRDVILADLKDLLRVDLPHAGGASFAQGIVTLSAGLTGSVREDGVYPFPTTLRSFMEALQVVDDPGMPTPTQTFFQPNFFYSDPDQFYQVYRFGNAVSDADYGKPCALLVYGRTLHLRPIPKQTAVAQPWWGTVVIAGTKYLDTDSLTEDTVCPERNYEALLVAKGTLLKAARRGRDDVIGVWTPIAQARSAKLYGVSLTTMSRAQPASDF